MSLTRTWKLKTDYAAGPAPGTGTPLSPADLVAGNAMGDVQTVGALAALGPGILAVPDITSWQVSAGAGLSVNILPGAGIVNVATAINGISGYIYMRSTANPFNLASLTASSTLYIYATVQLPAGSGDPDSRADWTMTFTFGTSANAPNGSLTIAKVVTGLTTVTSVDLSVATPCAVGGAGQVTKDVTGAAATVALTPMEAKALNVQFMGVLSQNTAYTVPATPRLWYMRNDTTGSFSLTVKTASGTGVAVAQGTGALLLCDGTNVVLPSESFINALVADLALKAPLASPALTGTPTAPTAAVDTNSTQIATTAFVIGQNRSLTNNLLDKILTDATGAVLVDASGNVLYSA